MLLAALEKRDRVRPALMQCIIARNSGDGASAGGASGGVGEADQDDFENASLQVVLWRSDALVAMLELDARLSVARADPAAGLMVGLGPKALLKKDFRR
mgnify:CR=1 FL=1